MKEESGRHSYQTVSLSHANTLCRNAKQTYLRSPTPAVLGAMQNALVYGESHVISDLIKYDMSNEQM